MSGKRFFAISAERYDDNFTNNETIDEAADRAKKILADNHMCGEVIVFAPVRIVRAKVSPVEIVTVAAE
jgi:hypothetical protein